MHSDKKIFFFWNCMAFLPSTFQRVYFWKVPLHFLEIWSKLYPVCKREKKGWVRKTQILTNLKAPICCEFKSWYIFLPTHANCENFWPVWKFGLCNRGQLGRINALSLYPLAVSCCWNVQKFRWVVLEVICLLVNLFCFVLFCFLVTNDLSLITRKPVFGVFDQVRLKPACAATEAS